MVKKRHKVIKVIYMRTNHNKIVSKNVEMKLIDNVS